MSDTNVRIGLTLVWAAHPEEAPWVEKAQSPSAEGLTQLFYFLNLLYAQSLDLEPDDPRMHHSFPRTWRASLVQWRRLLRGLSVSRRWTGPPASEWPGFVPLPEVPRGSELRVSGMAMASPLELDLAVPAAAIASPAGAYGVLRFIGAIEHAWNAPRRIRLEGLELDRRIYEERLERERAKQNWQGFDGHGFELHDGSVHFPEDWEWPSGGE
jgi:hypothetical protein